VFGSFTLEGQLSYAEIGLGFAAAIFVDAFVIRTVLVPAAMHVMGRGNWWLPGWLDRALPHLHVEAGDLLEGEAKGMTFGGLRPELSELQR
jgi:RND superfamily putative drug exporter